MRYLAAAALLLLAGAAPGLALAEDFDTGQIPKPVILTPSGPAEATVILFSGDGGWSDADAATAARLQAAGAAVVGIDLPGYFAALDAQGKDCVYLVSDFERLSHAIERSTGASTFHAPLIAGSGIGGALALDVLAQTPADTLAGAVVVDPAAGQPLKTNLCTSAKRETTADGAAYDLPAGPPPAELTLVLSSAAPPASLARADALSGAGVVLERKTAAGDARSALGDALVAAIALDADTGDAPAIIELPTTPAHDTMAIMISGDGGWRDLDKTVAGILQSKGVPTVGLDSLRWFWTTRTPDETATELARLIELYTKRWNVSRVILSGYSFGAAVLPDAYVKLPAEAQAKVVQMSLLAPAVVADWQITVSGWLGAASSDAKPIGPALEQVPAALIQCIYGREETDSACPSLKGTAAELVETKGGHHFDGNYAALATRIVEGLDQRAP